MIIWYSLSMRQVLIIVVIVAAAVFASQFAHSMIGTYPGDLELGCFNVGTWQWLRCTSEG